MPAEEQPIVPFSQRQGVLPPRWRWWLAEIPVGRLILLAALIILLGGGYWLKLRAARLTLDAMQETPRRQGTALVKSKENVYGSRATPPALWIAFEIDGHYVQTRTEDNVKWERTAVGDTVPVSYHIGKDAHYYVEDWTPQTVQ